MQLSVLFLFYLINSCLFSYGYVSFSLLSFSFLTSRQISKRHPYIPFHPSNKASPPANLAPSPTASPKIRHMTSSGPAPAPLGFVPAPAPHHGHHHHKRPQVRSPSFGGPDCSDLVCSDPLTTTPIGSPCGCVLPLQIELDLGVAPFMVFTVVPELEVEVAAGTYVKQSQVRIMSAMASGEGTRVDIDLLPLGEKFDNMTAFLIYERFWQKKVPINATVFGEYEVIYVQYPGLPSSPLSVPPGAHQLPFSAHIPPKGTQKLSSTIIAIISLSMFILALMCFGAICILLKWRKIRKPSTFVGSGITLAITRCSGLRPMIISSSLGSSASLSLISTMPTCPSSVKTFTLAEIEMATEKFSSNKILGEGGFGRVYHGVMEDGTEVAVKLLTREDQSGDREFIAEIEMLSRLHHRNLVKLFGICIEECTRCLVYELIRNGSVDLHLHGADNKNCLNWEARMKIALGAARGLAYLHEDSNPRVIHRDFKASNILLEDDFTPKVSDFGLAREASEGSHHISTRVMGTFGYVAPEYAMTGHLLVKSDVYSYGVVLLELLSGRKPVDMSQPQGQENLVTWARPLLTSKEGLEQLVDLSLGGNFNFDNMAKVAAIASMCVHPDVSQRPFMGEVVQALKLIYNDTNEACEDSYSQREELSAPDGDFRGEIGTGSSWWNADTPRLTFGYASSFITMEYSSSPLEEMDRPHSTSSLAGRPESPTRLTRSGPLRTKRHRSALSRLRGSMSEHELLSRRFSIDGYWI